MTARTNRNLKAQRACIQLGCAQAYCLCHKLERVTCRSCEIIQHLAVKRTPFFSRFYGDPTRESSEWKVRKFQGGFLATQRSSKVGILVTRRYRRPVVSSSCTFLFLRPSGTRAILFGSRLLTPCILACYSFVQQFLQSDKLSVIHIALVDILFVLQQCARTHAGSNKSNRRLQTFKVMSSDYTAQQYLTMGIIFTQNSLLSFLVRLLSNALFSHEIIVFSNEASLPGVSRSLKFSSDLVTKIFMPSLTFNWETATQKFMICSAVTFQFSVCGRRKEKNIKHRNNPSPKGATTHESET